MGRPRTSTQSIGQNRRPVRSRRRVDISKIRQPQRNELIALAAKIQELVHAEDAHDSVLPDQILEQAARELDEPPYIVLGMMRHFRDYHACHPGQPPANAFTPVVPGRAAKANKADQHPAQPVSPETDDQPQDRPRRRKSIMSVDEPQHSELIEYATDIRFIADLQDAYGNAPDGETEGIATKYGKTSRWIQEQAVHLRRYKAAYPDAPDAEAFTPLPTGRQKGRTVPDDIREAIEKAYISKA